VVNHLRRQKLLSFTLLLFTLSLGIVIGTLINTKVSAARGQSAAPDATPLKIPSPVELGNEFTKLARKLDPSVVNITAESTPKESRNTRVRPRPQDEEEDGAEDNSGSDPFRRFFQGPFGGRGGISPRMFRQEQSGTGFIVDRNGYIITNNHVIDKMDKIKVRLHSDSLEYRARVIGTDPESDLAVIKIDPKSALTPVVIANSESVQVGDWAVAIGSPFGLEASVTAGIVSATGRDVLGASQTFQRFIQTDAAINPGNSGGPLLNIRGEVIGVNTMIATQSGGYQGIGFALPINMAVRVYNDIIREGRVTRGSIGIQWNKYDKPELFKALGTNGGVLVGSVIRNGPAEKAGIKTEDIIVALNGKPVKDGDDLVNRVADLPIGSPASVSVDRAGKKMDFKLTIGDRAEVLKESTLFAGNRAEKEESAAGAEAAKAQFGISIRPMNDTEKDAIASLAKSGVKVTRVEPGSFAEEIGMIDSDVIVSINRQPVNSIEEVKKVQSSLQPGSAVAFRILRASPAQRSRGGDLTSLYLSGTLPAN
jgi:serine protease Do